MGQHLTLFEGIRNSVNSIEKIYVNRINDIVERDAVIKDLTDQCDTYRSELIRSQNAESFGKIKTGEIEFGTGKLYYGIGDNSAITVNELMQALKDVAMLVPVQDITAAIKRCGV